MAITYYDDTYYGDTYHGRSLRDLLLDPSRDVRMDAVRHRIGTHRSRSSFF